MVAIPSGGGAYGATTVHSDSRKGEACGTPHVYDELLEMALDAAVRNFLDKRQDIIEVLGNILGVQVSQHIGDAASDRNDMGMIVEKIIVRKDRRLDFTFIDGSKFKYELGDWTPKGSPAGRRKKAKK